MNAVTIGEVLWDLVEDEEHLGGAPFNFSVHLSRLGHNVSFVSAVGTDERGRKILECMAEMGLSTRYMRRIEDRSTGSVTVSLSADGQPQYVIHRPAAYDFPQLSERDVESLAQSADWICFGTLLLTSPTAKELTMKLLDGGSKARRFYDVNLRKDCWTVPLVRELMGRAQVVKLNDEEVRAVDQMFGRHSASLEGFCRTYAGEFGWESVCVTRGSQGCALLLNGDYVEAEGYAVKVADTVGAGDAFSAAFVHGLSSGWSAPRIADFANRVGALVASRPSGIPPWTGEEVQALR